MTLLVRLPDQFRSTRRTPLAATPTCCCCCCCCLATVVGGVTSLPNHIESETLQSVLGRPGQDPRPPIDPHRLRRARAWARGALPLTLATAIGAGMLFAGALDTGSLAAPLFFGVTGGALFFAMAMAHEPLPNRWFNATVGTLIFSILFAVEFFAGAMLVLATAGIGYLVFAPLAILAVTARSRRRLSMLRTSVAALSSPPDPFGERGEW